MAGTYSRNNPGKFPNRSFPKANRLNAIVFDKPSEPDGDDKDGFNGLQTIQTTTPHTREMSPMTGLPKTRLLVSVRFDFMSRTNPGASMPSAMRIATNALQMP
jgi:hypothetical protein